MRQLLTSIDRKKFIDAGVSFIYQLDEYKKTAVFDQVAAEFDDLLDLNQPEILKQRSKHFGVGESADYLNHLIATDEGDLIAGIRHLGGDRDSPFISIWPSFNIESTTALIDSVLPYFDVFAPAMISYWVRPDCRESSGYCSAVGNIDGQGDVGGRGSGKPKVVQQRFIGKIEQMPKLDLPLTRAKSYYEWYQSEYQKFHQQYPEYKNRITLNSKALMEASLNEGLLYFLNDGNTRVGLIAAEKQMFMAAPAIYLNEIIVAQKYRQKGFSSKLLAGFVNLLDADYFICDIDADNIPSTRAALSTGQTVFSQEIFVQI